MTVSIFARRVGAALAVLALGVSLSGCIFVPARGPGWCAYHPYRCR